MFILLKHKSERANPPGVADDERAEDGADSSTRPSHTNSGGTSSDELGCRVDVRLGCGGGEEVGGL